jgi:Uma2 family endonuclease
MWIMNSAALKTPIQNRSHAYEAPGLLHIPKEAHTLAGFRHWALSDELPEKLRVMFLHGEVYLDMGKEEIQYHALLKTEVGRVVANLNEEVDFGHLFINGVLVTNKAADVSNNPDMVAVFWGSLENGRCSYTRHGDREVEIVGSPDWMLEIVSDSSVIKDTQHLRQAYHQAGVREYWIVDARGEEMEFQILSWRESNYVAIRPRDGWRRSPVFGRHFRLTRKRDRSGAWKYRLECR